MPVQMRYRSAWMWLLVVVSGTAMAQICTPERGYEGYTYIVYDQSDVDEITAKCTTVNGSIAMAYNYTGGFHLPNIRNVTRSIDWVQSGHFGSFPNTTSVDLPDLEFLGGSLGLYSLPTLQSVTAPKLETVGWSTEIGYAREVDLRSLVESEYLQVRGNVSTLRLDSLRQVRQRMLICNWDECDPEKSPHGSLDLSLPALHDVGHLLLKGRFSSLGTPKLTNITGVGPGFYGIQVLTAGGPPIDLSFPELKYIRYASLFLEGNIASISIPSIRNLTVWLTVNAYDGLDINLPFEEADTITLSGNISSVQFPNLKSVDTLQVNTVASLDCEAFEETIRTATNTSKYQVNCRAKNSSSRLGLNLGAEIAFASAVGVVFGLAMSY
ncbi:hypothetical protein ABOM_004593 [Aspergillus bombycis]|uniref:GPI anchored protein n=1 Tax=Aspergillus bombycis TaxID=109264 RepID=A0A1F8A470_9EURO|nr:hypothetical protein ABOM_004593 [Aspergillus bombycis]OGM46540.1 hypothetical protein ABOM_004593 [Aspergillus bombycis]